MPRLSLVAEGEFDIDLDAKREQHRSSLELIWMRFDVSCRVLDRPLHLSIVETLPDEFYNLEGDRKAI